MSIAPSYDELKNSEYFWISATPYIAGLNEPVDGSINGEIISSFLYYESEITEVEEGCEFPFKALRIDIHEQTSAEVESLSGKYPIGFISFFDEGASARLFCRNELVDRMVSTLNAVKNGEIEFFLSIPLLPTELPSVYPILNYQYRVRNTSSKKMHNNAN